LRIEAGGRREAEPGEQLRQLRGRSRRRIDQAGKPVDRLVVQGILPDRAARLGLRDNAQALAGMVGEWEVFKAEWSRR